MRGSIKYWWLGVATLSAACSGAAPQTPTLRYASAAPAKLPAPTAEVPPAQGTAAPRASGTPLGDTLSPLPNSPPPSVPKAPRHDFHRAMPGRLLSKAKPAMKAAQLQPWQCRKERKRRKLPFQRDRRPAKGIATALRLSGPLNGVKFIAPGRKSQFGKLDCRLALILDDFSKILATHQIVEVRVDNFYRGGARLPGSRRKSQHSYGLAADITRFKTAAGLVLDVEDDWAGTRGQPPCGPQSSITEERESSILLRNMICDVARAGLFHHMLTPNYNEAHRDHFHLDIKRGARSGSIQ